MTRARRAGSAACGAVLVTLVVTVLRGLPTTTYGGSDAALLRAEAVAATALLTAGALASTTRRAVTCTVAGALWLLPELAGWTSGPTWLSTVAAGVAQLLPAVVLAGVAEESLDDPMARATATRLTLAAGGIAAATALVLVDPFLEPHCWRICVSNPWLVGSGSAVGDWVLWGTLAVLVVTFGYLVAQTLWRGGRTSPRSTAAAVGGLGAAGALLAGEARRRLGTESPQEWADVAVFVTTQAMALLLALAVCWERYREWRLGVDLARLAASLRSAPPAGRLARALGSALGDPGLRVDYWVAGRETYVDPDGRPVGAPGVPQRVTVVTRRGERLARLVHAADVDGDRVDRTLGAALRLALENEQLRAAALAELRELDESRARIVERAADERRRLERNLHDGAQQRVVALALLVRMLRNRAGSPGERALTDRAEILTRAALDELRRVARGIYPAVLADAGLAGAVLDLAQSSTDVAVEVEHLPRARFTGLVEATAYLVVEAALSDARAQQADRMCVTTTAGEGELTVAIRYPASGSARLREDLDDTVAALGGGLDVRSDRSGTEVRLVLPCAS